MSWYHRFWPWSAWKTDHVAPVDNLLTTGEMLKRRNERLTEWMRWQAFEGHVSFYPTFAEHPNCERVFIPLNDKPVDDWDFDAIDWEGFDQARFNYKWKHWLYEFRSAVRARAHQIIMDRTTYGFDAVKINPDGTRTRVDPASIRPHHG